MTRFMTFVLVAGCVCVAGRSAGAYTVTFELRPLSCTTVAVGGTVDYEIVAVVAGGSDGLAGFAVDLVTDTGVAQPLASPGAPQMYRFVCDNGLTNPAGFGGTADDDDLIQIGGGQNTVGNDAGWATLLRAGKIQAGCYVLKR